MQSSDHGRRRRRRCRGHGGRGGRLPAEVRSEGKIKKDGQPPEPLRLVENPDILAGLAAQRDRDGRGRRPVLVGFAAETDTAEQAARAKLARKGCDLLVVNPVGNGLGFGTPDNEAVVYGTDGTVAQIPRGPKEALANVVWDLVVVNLDVSAGRQMSRIPAQIRDMPLGFRGSATIAPVIRGPRRGNDVARRLFTSESVTEGHPDKMADQISDTVLDAMIKDDPASRVAVETLITTGQVHVAGEVTTKTYVDIPGIIREKILEIGYDSSAKGYDGASCGVSVSIGSQSPDIAQGVNDAFEYREGEGTDDFDRQGAGDQGLMFGYACRETPELMPLPIMLAHKLAKQLSEVRRSGTVPYLRPDGKTQVTIEYVGDRPVRLDTVVVSTQHAPDINLKELLAPDIRDYVVDPVLADAQIDTEGFRLLVNPTGRFEIGGPMGDAGLTGRKIIIDTYGGMARHGGGAFSGKDPSKVDRSAAYAMRWVAKNVVAAGLADRCEAQVAYAIGKAMPVGLFVECFGTEKVPVEQIQDAVMKVFDLRPRAIIDAPGPAAPDLRADRRVRALRPYRARLLLGARSTAPTSSAPPRAPDRIFLRRNGTWSVPSRPPLSGPRLIRPVRLVQLDPDHARPRSRSEVAGEIAAAAATGAGRSTPASAGPAALLGRAGCACRHGRTVPSRPARFRGNVL